VVAEHRPVALLAVPAAAADQRRTQAAAAVQLIEAAELGLAVMSLELEAEAAYCDCRDCVKNHTHRNCVTSSSAASVVVPLPFTSYM